MTGTRLGQVPIVASWMQYVVGLATEPERGRYWQQWNGQWR
jgi:hypothetical protein